MLLKQKTILETCAYLYERALKIVPPDVKEALKKAYERETSKIGKDMLEGILRNIEVAEERNMLICVDTGLPVYFVKYGLNARVEGNIHDAIRKGVEKVTRELPIRPSVVHPITRISTGTNTGERVPITHFELVPDSDSLEITAMPKGSGSEIQSFLKMYTPADGITALKKFVLDSVITAGGMPCPPTIVGVGIGGSFELVAKLAKNALLRPIGKHHHEAIISEIETDLLRAVNASGIGPMGLGGDTTALAVNVETACTHMTLNPIAVNTQCWRGLRAKAKIKADNSVEYL